MALLRSKLFDLELEKQRAETAAKRKSQVGSWQRNQPDPAWETLWPRRLSVACNASDACVGLQVGTGSRSEKIKTYNFKDTRVSDHRTKNNFDLNKVLDGDLEACIQSCITLDQQEQLEALAAE